LFGVSVLFFYAEPGSQPELGGKSPTEAEFLAELGRLPELKDRRQLLANIRRFVAQRT
jgi:hypothetical protein